MDALLNSGDFHPDPVGMGVDTDQTDLAGWVAPRRLRSLRHETAQHLVGSPPHGSYRGDPKTLIDFSPALVVDAGDDVVDAEFLANHSGRQDVGIVAAGNSGESISFSNSSFFEYRTVESDAFDCAPFKVRS